LHARTQRVLLYGSTLAPGVFLCYLGSWSRQVRNLVDARTLRDLEVFPAEDLAADVFKRPSKEAVQAAREV